MKGMIIGGKDESLQRFADEVRPAVEITRWLHDPSLAAVAVKNEQPMAVFVDLGGDPIGRINLANRVARTVPQALVFTVHSNKSPDLILEAFRSGVADFLVWPAERGATLAAVRRALEKVAAKSRKAEICSAFSIKGGQGVTSIAINLADHIQSLGGENVLLMDLNLYASDIGPRLSLDLEYTPFDLQKDIKRVDRALLFSSLLRHERGFYVLACADELSDADQITGEDVSRMLAVLSTHLDTIVIDLPHDFSRRTLAALDASDQILLVFQQDVPVIQNTLKVLQFFRELGYAGEKVRLVLNRNTRNGDLDSDDFARVFSQPLFATLPNDYKALLQSINAGKPLDVLSGESHLCGTIRELAGRLTGMAPAEPPQSFWKRTLARCMTGF